jgi:hypothetical protein
MTEVYLIEIQSVKPTISSKLQAWPENFASIPIAGVPQSLTNGHGKWGANAPCLKPFTGLHPRFTHAARFSEQGFTVLSPAKFHIGERFLLFSGQFCHLVFSKHGLFLSLFI